ncbi:MAG: hypothetical protein AAFZ38_03715 [Myxococcota bacterium]
MRWTTSTASKGIVDQVRTEEKDRTLADPPASGPAEKLTGTLAIEPVAAPPEALFGSERLGRLEAYPLTNDAPTARVSPAAQLNAVSKATSS